MSTLFRENTNHFIYCWESVEMGEKMMLYLYMTFRDTEISCYGCYGSMKRMLENLPRTGSE